MRPGLLQHKGTAPWHRRPAWGAHRRDACGTRAARGAPRGRATHRAEGCTRGGWGAGGGGWFRAGGWWAAARGGSPPWGGGGEPLVSWEVYIVASQQIPNAPKGGQQRRFIQVRGIEDPVISGRVHALGLHPGGEWFSKSGVRKVAGEKGREATAIEAVLG